MDFNVIKRVDEEDRGCETRTMWQMGSRERTSVNILLIRVATGAH